VSWWPGRRRAAGPARPGASPEAGEQRRVTLYTRAGCHLCEAAAAVLAAERGRARFALEVVDVDADPELVRRYGVRVPVVAIDGVEEFQYEVPADLLRARLGRNGPV
jgi:glutaredoxin